MSRTPIQSLSQKTANRLKQMASSPKQQIIRLAVGTLVSLIAMIGLLLSSDYSSQWLFYSLSLVLIAGILYAIPGYIGIWMWRMKDVFFKEPANKK